MVGWDLFRDVEASQPAAAAVRSSSEVAHASRSSAAVSLAMGLDPIRMDGDGWLAGW